MLCCSIGMIKKTAHFVNSMKAGWRCVRALWQSAGWSNLEGFTACFLAAVAAAYVGSFCMEQPVHEMLTKEDSISLEIVQHVVRVSVFNVWLRALLWRGGIGDSHLWKIASAVIILHISTSADICGRLNNVLREGTDLQCLYRILCLFTFLSYARCIQCLICVWEWSQTTFILCKEFY